MTNDATMALAHALIKDLQDGEILIPNDQMPEAFKRTGKEIWDIVTKHVKVPILTPPTPNLMNRLVDRLKEATAKDKDLYKTTDYDVGYQKGYINSLEDALADISNMMLTEWEAKEK